MFTEHTTTKVKANDNLGNGHTIDPSIAYNTAEYVKRDIHKRMQNLIGEVDYNMEQLNLAFAVRRSTLNRISDLLDQAAITLCACKKELHNADQTAENVRQCAIDTQIMLEPHTVTE